MLVKKKYITIPEHIRVFQIEERGAYSEQRTVWQPGWWVWIWIKKIQTLFLPDLIWKLN